jgi:chitodextrinase
MKNLFKFNFLLVWAFICFSPVVYGQLISVDGVVEAAWNTTEWRPIGNILQGADSISDEADFSAKHKVLWDATGIFVLVEIQDDILVNDITQYFNNDMVEIYFDMDNSKNILKPGSSWNVTSYDDNDFQFKHVIGVAGVTGGPAGANVNLAYDITQAGKYVLEFHFSWADLGLTEALAEGAELGFDITVGDNDGGNTRDSYLGWNTPSGEAYHDASLFGTLTLLAGNVTEVPSGIVIDGKPDPVWHNMPSYKINKVIQGVENINPNDFSGSFKTFWNEEGIYVWALVLDDTLTPDGHKNYFNNDMIEIYFDMNNSKNPLPEGSSWKVSSYDENDFQFHLIFSKDTIFGGGKKITDVAQVIDEGNFYSVEMLFTWANLGLSEPLSLSDTIGFDVVIGDNDGGTTRKSMLSWHTIDGEAYHDASRFGTLYLDEGGMMSIPEGIVIDGKKDPLWASVEKRPIETIVSGAASIRDNLDFSGYHQVYWDQSGLYLLVQVNDDTLTTTAGLPYWQVDNIEVYLDMDNSKTPCPGCAWNQNSYDANDFQFQLRIGGELNERVKAGYADYSQNIFEGGYLVEFFFPFDSLNIDKEFAVGDLIGFDVFISDNDDSATRDAQLSWFDDKGEAYHNPSRFGTIELLVNGMTEPRNECETIPPTQPTNLTYENLTASFMIYWDASEDNVAVIGYEVYRVDETEDVLVGSVFGTEIEIFDFESEGAYSFKVRAYDGCENFSAFSDVLDVVAPEVIKYTIVKATSAVTLDGKRDESFWNDAVWDVATIYKKDPSNESEDVVPAEQDLHVEFAFAWDDDYLYAFIDVSDADVVNWDGTSNDWPTRNVPFQFDCVELCIAGSNERYISDAGLKPGDSQWRFNTGVSNKITGNPGSADLNTYNVEFAEGISLRNAGGYTFEIKFPWSAVFRDITIPADLGEGTEFLFAMITIDNDGRKDGDMFLRDHELAYWDGTGSHWKQTNGYKTAQLSLGTDVQSLIQQVGMTVYPNPAKDLVNIKMENNIQSVSFYDIMGKEVIKLEKFGSSTIEIPINGLEEGIYLIRSTDTHGRSSMSRFVKH